MRDLACLTPSPAAEIAVARHLVSLEVARFARQLRWAVDEMEVAAEMVRETQLGTARGLVTSAAAHRLFLASADRSMGVT